MNVVGLTLRVAAISTLIVAPVATILAAISISMSRERSALRRCVPLQR